MNKHFLLRIWILSWLSITSGCDSLTNFRDRKDTSDLGESVSDAGPKNSGVRDTPIALSVAHAGLCGQWLKSDFPQRFKTTVLENPRELSSSLCLHMLSAFGSQISVRTEVGMEERLLDILLNQERAIEILGHPTLYESAFGVRPYARPEAGRGSQAHHDQLLCCLAQMGVSPNVRSKVGGQDRTVNDLLADSLADFFISKKELAFTAIAYAHLLPPRRSWKNKFDEEVSFSDVVDELLSRDIGASHCFGTHLFEAMIVIYRVDREHGPILNANCRKRLEKRIAELVSTAVGRQKLDGSWGSRWFSIEPLPDAEDDSQARPSMLLVTGHLIQMLAKLPDQFPVHEHVFQRGLRCLEMATSQASDEEMRRDFCPFSHAAWCLNHFGAFHEPSPNSRAVGSGKQ